MADSTSFLYDRRTTCRGGGALAGFLADHGGRTAGQVRLALRQFFA